MAQYKDIGNNDGKSQVSEEEAMAAFSKAKLDGVKIMDLPDAPKRKVE